MGWKLITYPGLTVAIEPVGAGCITPLQGDGMALLIVGCPRGGQALTATLLNALQYLLQLLITILLQFVDHEVGN